MIEKYKIGNNMFENQVYTMSEYNYFRSPEVRGQKEISVVTRNSSSYHTLVH